MSDNRGRMPRSAQIEDRLVAEMRADLTRPRWWQSFRGRVLAIGVGSALLLGGGVAAVTLLDSRNVSETTVVYCLDRPSRNLDGSLPGSAVSLASPDGVLPLEDAVGACESLWAAGAFSSADPLDPSPNAVEVPPHFTTCVTDGGAAAVVPGRIECSVLDLHPYEPAN